MPQEDHLKKQIDQLGRVLGKILADLIGHKAQGQIIAEPEAIYSLLKDALDIDDLLAIPIAELMTTLLSNNKFNNDNFEKLADILFLMAEEVDQGNKLNLMKNKLFERSLIIYEYLNKSSMTYSLERHLKMVKIKNIL